MKNKVYTTREVGSFCGVDLTTAINWINQGRLKAYKTAGGHRRIKLEDLRKFMEEFSMPVPPELQETSGIKALVAVKDPDILNLISQAFKKIHHDCKFAAAADSFEAGNKLATFKPDIIILDLSLPEIDEKVIGKIRVIENNVKILALTAHGDNKTREKALNEGSDGCIARPFSVNDLLNAVTEILE